MKVVLFCGGFGTRLRELSEELPKPMVHIGYRPILWHVMKYYAHFGHRDFILCLGYKADKIKDYFLNYRESVSNNFTLSDGGRTIDLETRDIEDWRITFVDTGLNANVGTRLRAVRPYVENEEMFLANYADGLTDLDLSHMIATFEASGKVACCLCAKPSQSFHVVQLAANNQVSDIHHVRDSDMVINAGYFVLRREIFDYMREGEELVVEPFRRLIQKKLLLGYPYERFWCMDTFKEHGELTQLYESGNAPWEVWRSDARRRRGKRGGEEPPARRRAMR
jgi:glucose-1-phosphate cytidylyltransferase